MPDPDLEWDDGNDASQVPPARPAPPLHWLHYYERRRSSFPVRSDAAVLKSLLWGFAAYAVPLLLLYFTMARGAIEGGAFCAAWSIAFVASLVAAGLVHDRPNWPGFLPGVLIGFALSCLITPFVFCSSLP